MMKLLAFVLAAVSWASAGVVGQGDDDRIIKGVDANEGEFPFMVSLRRTNASPGHSCGASVLTSNWALTAAHCCKSITKNGDFYLYTGSIYLSRGGSKHSIEKVTMHENFAQHLHFRNDICLIRVKESFNISNQVTLAPQGWPVNSEDKVTVAGWGLTNPSDIHSVPDRLQKGVDFVALSQNECARVTKIPMIPGYLCIYGALPGQTAWKGDSGGPLVKDGAQVGLTSFGFFPYGNGMPVVFCRVTEYVNWIKQKLGPESSQLKFR